MSGHLDRKLKAWQITFTDGTQEIVIAHEFMDMGGVLTFNTFEDENIAVATYVRYYHYGIRKMERAFSADPAPAPDENAVGKPVTQIDDAHKYGKERVVRKPGRRW